MIDETMIVTKNISNDKIFVLDSECFQIQKAFWEIFQSPFFEACPWKIFILMAVYLYKNLGNAQQRGEGLSGRGGV